MEAVGVAVSVVERADEGYLLRIISQGADVRVTRMLHSILVAP